MPTMWNLSLIRSIFFLKSMGAIAYALKPSLVTVDAIALPVILTLDHFVSMLGESG